MAEKARKSPHPVDIHVGSRMRMRRMLLSMSQDKLGEALDLTFQQIQKYEKGINRIGASRLFQVSRILDVPIQYFYDDYGDEHVMASGFAESNAQPSGTSDFMALLSTPEGVQLCKSFANISDPKIRKKVLDLVKTLSDEELVTNS